MILSGLRASISISILSPKHWTQYTILSSGNLYLALYLNMGKSNLSFLIPEELWLFLLGHPGGFKTGPQVICHSSHPDVQSLSLALEPEQALLMRRQ